MDGDDVFSNYGDELEAYVSELELYDSVELYRISPKCWVVDTVKFQKYLKEHYNGKYHLLYLNSSGFHVEKPAFYKRHVKNMIKEQIWADLVFGRPDYEKGLIPFTNEQVSYYICKWRGTISKLAMIYMNEEATRPENDHIRELMYVNKFNPVKKTRDVKGLGTFAVARESIPSRLLIPSTRVRHHKHN